MHYQKIQQILSESDPKEHWVFLTTASGRETWFYVGDVNLRIESVHAEDDGLDIFEEEWATKHPDPRARRCYYEIWYASTLVDQIMLVAVDGYRAYLPLPDPQTRTKVNASSIDFKVAEIVDRHGTLYDYIRRSGLTLVDGDD